MLNNFINSDNPLTWIIALVIVLAGLAVCGDSISRIF